MMERGSGFLGTKRVARCALTSGIAVVAFAAVVVGASVPAHAQDGRDRFQMERVGEEVLRLDRQTGKVELCAEATATFACRTVVEGVVERPTSRDADVPASGALLSENQALRAENAALKRRLQMIRALVDGVDAAGGAVVPPRGLRPGGGPLGLPSVSREELDQALDMTDYAVRRFRDIFRGLADETPSR